MQGGSGGWEGGNLTANDRQRDECEGKRAKLADDRQQDARRFQINKTGKPCVRDSDVIDNVQRHRKLDPARAVDQQRGNEREDHNGDHAAAARSVPDDEDRQGQ